MANDDHAGDKLHGRRHALECMLWAGTGVLWTLAGGVPKSLELLGSARAADGTAAGGLTFLQISDSHVGFDKPANPNALGTLREAVAKISTLPQKPAFMIHTGDVSHLSKPKQFDDAEQVIGGAKLDVHYVPGEHDVLDEGHGKAFQNRYAAKSKAKGAGWYAFDQQGVHFVALVNVVDLKAAGLGNLGAAQLAWLAGDLSSVSASTPHCGFCPYSAVDGLTAVGLGYRGRGTGARSSEALRLGDGPQRPHTSTDAEG